MAEEEEKPAEPAEPPVQTRPRRRGFRILVGGLWAAIVAAGLLSLSTYDGMPGKAAAAPPVWPASSRLERTPGRSTLVLVLHPQCPCSRASVDELAILMTRFGDRLDAHALLVVPPGVGAWTDTALRDRAMAVPGVQVTADPEAVEATCFGAATSGQTYLFDPAGTLRFSGGITAARGHVGDNAGTDAIAVALRKPGAPPASSPVYGCALSGPAPPTGLRAAWRAAIESLRARWWPRGAA